MSLLAVSVSHRTASLEDLERIHVPASALVEALPCLLRATRRSTARGRPGTS
jgi:glutamyl-tRNA reductase